MKSTIRIAIALAAAFAAASCAKEALTSGQGAPESGEGLVPVTFTVNLDENKSTLDGGKVCWTLGEEVGIYEVLAPAEGSNKKTVAKRVFAVAACDGTTATISGEVTEGALARYVVYPASTGTACDTLGTISISLPASQKIAQDATIAANAIVEVGQEVEGAISLKNVVSLLKFEISGADVVAVKFIASGAEKIVGAAKTGVDGVLTAATGSSALTVLPDGDCFAPGVYYATVLPDTLETGFRIAANTSTGTVLYRSSTTSNIFPRNGGRNVGDFAPGDGGADELPAVIMDAGQFKLFADNADLYAEGTTVSLGDNIDMGDVCTGWVPAKEFNGIFDGAGHCIYNFVIESSSETGIFGKIRNGGIKDVTFGSSDGTTYDGISLLRHANSVSTRSYAAPIVALSGTSSASNIVNFAKVEVTGNNLTNVSGVISTLDCTGEVKGCKNYGEITASGAPVEWLDMGGIIGAASSQPVVSGCYNYGPISYTGTTSAKTINEGGIMGGASGGKFTDCHNAGAVSVANTLTATGAIYCGGICGNNNGVATFTDCVNEQTGTVTNNAKFGGAVSLAGIVSYTNVASTVKGCVNHAPITNNGVANAASKVLDIAGIVGYQNANVAIVIDGCTNESTAVISNTANHGSTIVYAMISGCVGSCKGGTTIKNCINKAELKNSGTATHMEIGGFIGEHGGAAFKLFDNNVNSGNITNTAAVATRYCLGGVVGRAAQTIAVTKSSNSGSITGNGGGPLWIGGVVGSFETAASSITDSHNTGTVLASGNLSNAYAGGVVGYAAFPLTMTSCTNVANVTFNGSKGGNTYQYIGGVIGSLHASSAKSQIKNSSNSGVVTYKGLSTAANGVRVGGICGGTVGATFTGCINSGNVIQESNSTQAHFGGVVGYISGTSTIDGCECTAAVHLQQKGDATTANIGGILGATGAKDSVIKNCKSAATIEIVSGTVGTANAHQMEGGKYSQDLKTIDKCGIGGVVLGTTVDATNYEKYINASGTPTNCYFLSE